jgi:hypothetical protein
MIHRFIAASMLLAAHCVVAAPRLEDYVRGVAVEATDGLPLIELPVPDEAYRAVTQANLQDIRVFNAQGVAVPHALCSARSTSAPAVTEQSLSVFQLQEGRRLGTDGTRVEVQTAGGTQVKVQEASPAGEIAAAGVHIIDARSVEDAMRAIRFEWRSPDGASEVKVRIESSADLDRWDTLVAVSTLLEVTDNGQRLRRERVELPQRRYEYLRVQRTDGGPPLEIQAAIAERVAAAPMVEPWWFTAESVQSREADTLLFGAARLAPVQYARAQLPQENSSVRVTIQSRADDESAWRDRWSGEIYLIAANAERRASPPGTFEPTTDRYWRVRLPENTQLAQPLILELAYRPLQLRFLAQGGGPFTLAFGSRRAESFQAARCDDLIADVSAADRQELIAEGRLGAVRTLGGETALVPLPKKTPVRLVILWSVLVVGAAVVVAMALSLLKRLRGPESS